MKSRFAQSVKVVTIAHVVTIAACTLLFGWCSCGQRREAVMPVEFVVDVASEPAVESLPAAEAAPAAPPAERLPAIRTSTKRIHRRVEADGKPALSEDEIRRLLTQGAEPSDHTRVPEEDARGYALVRQALYRAWEQPSVREAGDAAAEAAIRLTPDGRLSARRLSKPSGNAVLDASVLQAVDAVRSIEGLPTGFATRHPEINVSFRVE